MNIEFRTSDTLQIFRKGKTSNAKISAPNEVIIQSYSFSKLQFEEIKKNMLNPKSKKGMHHFFSLDLSVCGDCPFSRNKLNGSNGGCYTHKFNQYVGFISMLKATVKKYGDFESIPFFNSDIQDNIIKASKDKFVRFGTYGEPSLHPIKLVEEITKVAKNWSGYTHQYARNKDFSAYFMASVHNDKQAILAKKYFGYRSFIAAKKNDGMDAVICPASKEANFKSNCSKCGLCSGTKGKGKKNVVIIEH